MVKQDKFHEYVPTLHAVWSVKPEVIVWVVLGLEL